VISNAVAVVTTTATNSGSASASWWTSSGHQGRIGSSARRCEPSNPAYEVDAVDPAVLTGGDDRWWLQAQLAGLRARQALDPGPGDDEELRRDELNHWHADDTSRRVEVHPDTTHDHVAWSAALDSAGGVREGAWIAELTGLLNLTSWPTGMRVIVRAERPHPGAQLRIIDADGNRVTAFATNTRPGGPAGQIADLELRHRRRARCEDRIRNAKDTGLNNLPLHGFDQNRIWSAVVMMVCDLLAWTQMLGFADHPARRWEPKRLRLRLFSIAGRLARHTRRLVLHLGAGNRWTDLLLTGRTAVTGQPRPG